MYAETQSYTTRVQIFSWNDRVKIEEVLHRVKEQRNFLRSIKRRKANWIRHMFCRNCILKHIIEGKIERGLCDRETRKKTYAATGLP